MYNIGDLVIYSAHGICKITDITEKTYGGVTQNYYVLQPIDETENLTINAPIEKAESVFQKLMEKDEANKVIESFHEDGVDWIDKPQSRNQTYNKIMNSGDRMDIAKVANTLLQKRYETEVEGKKFSEIDKKLLQSIESILFKEVSLALNVPFEKVTKKIGKIIESKQPA